MKYVYVILDTNNPYACSLLWLFFLSMWQFAVDLLIEVYKITLNEMGGYIVNTEKVPNGCQTFISSMVVPIELYLHVIVLLLKTDQR